MQISPNNFLLSWQEGGHPQKQGAEKTEEGSWFPMVYGIDETTLVFPKITPVHVLNADDDVDDDASTTLIKIDPTRIPRPRENRG
jgi:hypothetical protein